MKKLVFLMFIFTNVIVVGQTKIEIGGYSINKRVPEKVNSRVKFLGYHILLDVETYSNKISALKFVIDSDAYNASDDFDAFDAELEFDIKLKEYFNIDEDLFDDFSGEGIVEQAEYQASDHRRLCKIANSYIVKGVDKDLDFFIYKETNDYILYLHIDKESGITWYRFESKRLNRYINRKYKNEHSIS